MFPLVRILTLLIYTSPQWHMLHTFYWLDSCLELHQSKFVYVDVEVDHYVSFTPEVLGVTATTGFLILGFELLLIKTGFYLLNCGSVAIYDLTAYCGYKFVGYVLISL